MADDPREITLESRAEPQDVADKGAQPIDWDALIKKMEADQEASKRGERPAREPITTGGTPRDTSLDNLPLTAGEDVPQGPTGDDRYVNPLVGPASEMGATPGLPSGPGRAFNRGADIVNAFTPSAITNYLKQST